MRMQDEQKKTFFGKIGTIFFRRGKRWLAFLHPPVPVQSDSPFDDRNSEKLPGFRQSLQRYERRIIEAGIGAAFLGLLITLDCSWVWPLLIGLGIVVFFIGILLKYRLLYHLQHPIIAFTCVRSVLWLVFIEIIAVVLLLIWIYVYGQVIHILPGMWVGR